MNKYAPGFVIVIHLAVTSFVDYLQIHVDYKKAFLLTFCIQNHSQKIILYMTYFMSRNNHFECII